MTITPLKPVNSLEQLQAEGFSTLVTPIASESRTFADAIRDFITPANLTAAQTKSDSLALSNGLYTDNLHNIEIAAQDADLALRTMVSVRNKVLDAYSEIMRMTF